MKAFIYRLYNVISWTSVILVIGIASGIAATDREIPNYTVPVIACFAIATKYALQWILAYLMGDTKDK